MKRLWQLAIGLALIVFALGSGLARADGGLRVSGNQILNDQGQAVMLKGVAVADPYIRRTVDGRTAGDYEVIKEVGANVVRLSVHPGFFKSDQAKVQFFLEDEVAAARQAGLYVIIVWHVIGAPDGWYKQDTNLGLETYSSDFPLAKEFWQYAADRFKPDQGILFELWNEPVSQDSSKRLDWSVLGQYWVELCNLVRGNGAGNIIIVSGPEYSYDLSEARNYPLWQKNLAYAWHVYPHFQRLMPWASALGGMNRNFPVIVTEWGYDDGEGSNYRTNEFLDFPQAFPAFIAAQGLHFTAWCWHAKWKPRLLSGDHWEYLTPFGETVAALFQRNYPPFSDKGEVQPAVTVSSVGEEKTKGKSVRKNKIPDDLVFDDNNFNPQSEHSWAIKWTCRENNDHSLAWELQFKFYKTRELPPQENDIWKYAENLERPNWPCRKAWENFGHRFFD